MSIKDNLDKYLKNLNYQLQVESMGLNSWGDIKPRQQNRQFELPSTEKLLNNSNERENKQLARQQQIQLYLEKEKRPITINGVEYKYNNLPEPNIEDIDPLNDEVNRAKFEYEQQNNNYVALTRDIKDLEEEIENTKNDFEKQKTVESKLILNKEFSQNLLNKMETKIKRYDQIINSNNKLINDLEQINITGIPKQLNEARKKKYIEQNDEYRKQIEELIPEGENILYNIIETEKNISKNNNLLKDIKRQFDELKVLKKQLLRDFNIAEVEIVNKKADLEQATNVLTNAKKENKKLIDEYSSELKRVNFGSFNIDKIGNETDEEYFKRISTNAQVPFDNSTTKTLSDIERNKQFKENLKSLFQSESYIEQILNHFKTTNDHFIFIFNQYFNLFKDDYLKIFGYDNKSILDNPEEFIDLVENFCQAGNDGKPELITPSKEIQQRQNLTSNELVLSKLSRLENIMDPTINLTYEEKVNELTRLEQQPNLTGEEQFMKGALSEVKTEQDVRQKIAGYILGYKDNQEVLQLQDPNDTSKNKYIRYFNVNFDSGDFVDRDDNGNIINRTGTINFKTTKKGPIILMSDSGKLGTFYELSPRKSVRPSIYKDLLIDFLSLNSKEIQNLFNQTSTDNLKLDNLKKIIEILQIAPTMIQGNPALINKPGTKVSENPKLGYGIKDETPEYVEFGKHILLLKKLFLKNILSLHKKNHQKIAGFKNYNVSNEFVNLIMKILKKENISISDIANLKIGEKELLDNLLSLCELNKKIITGTGVDTISKIKEQLKLIEGQIEAGNNNPVMKDELYKTLFKLVNFGAISEKQARSHYKNICNDFFN